MRPDQGTDLRTTIDPAWRGVAETALAEAGVSHGAVVMLALPNHDVIALANRDTVRPAAIPAVMAQVPGSVFKLVTAAAALDTFRYRFDSRFYCPGVVRIPGVHMRCWTEHGRETLATAIAESCDTVFAEVGVHVGRAGLAEMARRLGLFGTGLAEAGGHPVLSEAQAGVVFRYTGEDAGLLANTAIGQQDVRISPVQAARLAAAVADDGWTRDARLVLDAERMGRVLQTFAPAPAHRAFSALTAWQLKRAMRLAVTSPAGTAHALEREHLAVAAKTGTAELDAAGHVNGWMVGFFPYDHPAYAFCVFVGNMPSPAAHRAVVEITRRLTDAYLSFHPPTADEKVAAGASWTAGGKPLHL
jgi:cell division protein FtsI/penicillin-binding protein 2